MDSYKKIISFTAAILSLILFSPVPSITADDLDNQVREISHKLRCPTCQAMSVKESDAGLSVNMKNKVREMLKEGKSEEEILSFFEERYGEWILRSPKKEGFNLLLWLLPGTLLVAASLFLILTLINRNRAKSSNQVDPLSQSEKDQIEKDLKSFQSK